LDSDRFILRVSRSRLSLDNSFGSSVSARVREGSSPLGTILRWTVEIRDRRRTAWPAPPSLTNTLLNFCDPAGRPPLGVASLSRSCPKNEPTRNRLTSACSLCVRSRLNAPRTCSNATRSVVSMSWSALTDLPFLPKRDFAEVRCHHLGGETLPRRGSVRRRLIGFFRDNFGAGSVGNTRRISCWAAT
jgi:hypothetical protein